MGEHERMKYEMEVGLHLLSQWESKVIYCHLTDFNAIRGDLYYYKGKIMMVFSFVQTSFITLAGISFLPLHKLLHSFASQKAVPMAAENSFYGFLHNKQYLTPSARGRGEEHKNRSVSW